VFTYKPLEVSQVWTFLSVQVKRPEPHRSGCRGKLSIRKLIILAANLFPLIHFVVCLKKYRYRAGNGWRFKMPWNRGRGGVGGKGGGGGRGEK
jgi:hypothetical protein